MCGHEVHVLAESLHVGPDLEDVIWREAQHTYCLQNDGDGFEFIELAI